jgi:threonine/homoserine/homoserine lactone efflux protein
VTIPLLACGDRPGKSLGLALLLAGVNPKNLMLAAAAGSGLAQLGLSRTDALVSLIVFVMIASLTIAAPVACCLLRETAKARLHEKKDRFAVHNNAVIAVQFLVLGAKLIADAVPPVT